MDLLTKADLKTLAEHGERGPAVSLFTPTSRVTVEVQADRLRWKNLLSAVDTSLHDEGVDRDAVKALLAPAWELHADIEAWQHMSDGLAMFLRPGWHRDFRVPVDVPQLAVVGDRFVVSPLVGAISSEDHFLLLAVSQRNVRLLEGTRRRVEEIELREVPTSLRDVVEAQDPRSDTMARPLGGGRSGPAVFHGHGAADDEFKNEELTRFLRHVADGLHEYLTEQSRPMVLVGLDRNVAAYRNVNSYGNVLDGDASTNPDQLSAEELHDVAWPIAAEHFAQAKKAAVEHFEQEHGTGLATTDEVAIRTAAHDGRIAALFVASEPSCWERAADGGATVIRLGADPDFASCELLDEAALATVLSGGDLYSVSSPSMFDGQSMAATFRY